MVKQEEEDQETTDFINSLPPAKPEPEPELVETKSVTTTKSPVITEEEEKLRGEQDKILEQKQGLVNKQAELDQKQAEIEQTKAAEQLRAENDYQQRAHTIYQKAEKELNTLENQMKTHDQKLQSMKIQDFYETRGTGSKILAAIAMGLGALGSGLSGQPNHAVSIIKDTIDRDYKQQQAKIDNQKELLEQTGRMSDRVRARLTYNIAIEQNKKANALKKTALLYEQKLSKLQPGQISLEQQKALQELKEAARNEKLQAYDKMRSIVQTVTTKELEKIDPKAQATIDRETFKSAKDIRAEYNKHPVVLAAKQGTHALKGLDSNLKQKTKAGDLAAIFSFMKTLDPRSVVREGEQQQVIGTGGLAGIAQSYIAKINDEGVLTDASRKELYDAMQAQVKAQAAELPRIQKEEFDPILKRFDIGSELVYGKPQPMKEEDKKFPMTLRKDNMSTTVDNQQELEEAQAEGWK